ncbi:MAG: rod shape-determining protein RodA [Verrucomicrobiales bacterium]|nr:rod shape-determining protein RodA [Verrucomicrobiales bacterium]
MNPEELNLRPPRFAWAMLGAAVLLMGLSLGFVYSSTLGDAATTWKQLIWFVAGLGLAVALCLADYHVLARWAWVGYWAAILLLILVMVVGVERNGARRWIDLGPFQLQPSEFAKLAVLFGLAQFLSRPVEELRFTNAVLKSMGIVLLPFALILKEPDLGSALVLLPMMVAMMYVAGVPTGMLWRILGAGAVVAGLLVADVLFAPEKWRIIKLKDYQRHRLLVYFGKDFAPANATPEQKAYYRELQRHKGWNVQQALISVGSGGVTGKGWRRGTVNGLGYLPRLGAHNDFIFSVIAEESGFIGSVAVVGLYTVVLFSGLMIAGQARDRLGRLVAVGVVALWFAHVFINIGMNIGLMPVTGIPLPLLSYGGSAAVCALLALGFLQNVHLYRRSY